MSYLSQQHICETIGSIHDPETEYLETEVLDMFNNKNPEKYEDTLDPKLLTWIATYYDNIDKNKEKMINFLNKAVQLGDTNAMNNLGCHYFSKFDFQNARKMWVMGGKSQKNLQVLAEMEQLCKQLSEVTDEVTLEFVKK